MRNFKLNRLIGSLLFAGVITMAFTQCSSPPPAKRDLTAIKLLTRLPEKDPLSMQALIRGRLWIHENCVKIGETPENSQTTIWRSGFLVGQDENGLFIHHPDQKERHGIGDKVRFAGGYVNKINVNRIEGESLKDCSGPYIVIDETMVRKKWFWQG